MTAKQFSLSGRVALEPGPKGGAHVLVDTHSATLCSCNESAWTILCALQNGATVEQLVELITKTYDVGEGSAKSDALDFIHRLAAMGLIDEG